MKREEKVNGIAHTKIIGVEATIAVPLKIFLILGTLRPKDRQGPEQVNLSANPEVTLNPRQEHLE